MVVANKSSNTTLAAVQPAAQRRRSQFSGIVFWVAGIALVFVVPLLLVLGAVFVSSWGIPLPIYVAIP